MNSRPELPPNGVPSLSLTKVGEETKAGEKGLGAALDDLAVSSSLG